MKHLGASTDFAAVPTVSAVSLIAGIGYYTIFANSGTTFPARSTVPSWWTGRVLFDSTEYLNHADPTDRITNDQHISRTA